jgi:hypothetical protein
VSKGGAAPLAVRDRRLRLGGIVASVALVLIAFVLALTGGDGRSDRETVDTSPHLVDPTALTALEDTLGHPVYWAGERPAERLELTQEADGSVYVRYLPPEVAAGDQRASFLTIGTYPVTDAQAAVRRAASAAGRTVGHVADDGIVLANPGSRGSVYLAYPGTDIQIEVYDPQPGKSLELIRSGAIGPVGG